MAKTSAGLRSWRRRQKKHAIMTPEKFEEIKHKAAAGGATSPEAVAGAAYWTTAKAKYRSATSRRARLRRRKKK